MQVIASSKARGSSGRGDPPERAVPRFANGAPATPSSATPPPAAGTGRATSRRKRDWAGRRAIRASFSICSTSKNAFRRSHLLRRINPVVTQVLAGLREKLEPFYSEIGRPSIDPELMIRMLIVGYCYGIRSERRLCEEVEMHLAYRWFCRLDLDDRVPDHSTFSVNRHGRFRSSNIFRQLFEAVVRACMDAGLVQGEGFAIDASVIEANASRYHGKTPGEIDWSAPERQTRAVVEFLSAIDDDDPNADRKLPKVISPVDPCSAWTAKANKRVQFGYGLNYLIDTGPAAVILDVEATPARTYDEVAATQPMLERTETTLGLKPAWLAGDTAYGIGRLLAWLWTRGITPHIPC